eukprot:TRINITY_DN5839_c0_g1_i1.p1 TRINITY_DN5839_c0_g1~~TRINITY_DN5839_c0_g1_i1.p1  ORF type:complete len:542 (-),score=107.05 TRINITY_DN5839_c0_g1_i1:118-1743(-)
MSTPEAHNYGNGFHGSGESSNELHTVGDFQIKRSELVRLLTQSLHNLGYHTAAESVEKESGVVLQSPIVASFREAILTGDWASGLDLLAKLDFESTDGLKEARFLVYSQKLLELLEQQKSREAITCLRSEITPLQGDVDRVKKLASFMMCKNAEELRRKANWSGVAGSSRVELLRSLQSLLSSSLVVPEGRLDELLNQALAYQCTQCAFHNSNDTTMSLFADHTCSPSDIPDICTQVLDAHSHEVWAVQFSHNGTMLASCGRDCNVIIWEVQGQQLVQLHMLQGHENAVSLVQWSPDDAYLLSGSNDSRCRIWDTTTGLCKLVVSKHLQAITAAAWFPDGRHFVTGSSDKHAYLWSLDGAQMQHWEPGRVTDLAVTNTGEKLLVASGATVREYGLLAGTEITLLTETSPITSICLSADSKYLLVNINHACAAPEIRMYNLETLDEPAVYSGMKQQLYVIRSRFGGSGQSFVVSGSEDSLVYIWHRQKREVLCKLTGHTGVVNDVAWNPRNPHMFVSASDDHTIRVWGTTTSSNGDATAMLD